MEDTVKFNVGYLTKTNELSKIHEVSLSNDNSGLIQLKSKVSETFGIPLDSFDIYLGTKCLECLPDCNVKDVGLASGMKLYAIEKLKASPVQESSTSAPDFEVVRNAMYGLSTMFSHRRSRQRHKTAIIKLIEDKEAMNSIIKSIAGLENDRIALDIMENAKLLEVMLEPKNTKKIIDNYPRLATAFVQMWNSLMSSSKYSNFEPVATSSSASNSQELMDVDSVGSRPQTNASSSTLHNITSSQLAAALAQTFSNHDENTNVTSTQGVTNATTTPGAASTSNRTPQRHDHPPSVTPEAMQQALINTGFQQVSESVMSDSASGVTSTTVSEDAIKSGLEQLKAMGITDEAVCRQALVATQGNVEAAINIIFSGS